ncbi:MAG: GCN5-related N-acetyltransferase [Thermoleophilia bacterium]|nr:GCN5-related N-acetyltransferase [Thermoleophilia bacterium]
MKRLPRLQCGPVELRLVTPRSAQQMYALARDPEVSRLLQWPPHRSVDDSLEFIHEARTLWERRTAWLPGIFDLERGKLVGATGIHGIDEANRRGEVGTWLGVPHQRRGFNLPAKAAVVTFGFQELQLARLEFLVRVDNERSLRAMRQLPAIREEGVLAQRIWRDGAGHDAVLFALLADEFEPSAWPDVHIDR